MKFTEENGRIVIEAGIADQEAVELEQLRRDKDAQKETERKLAIVLEKLGLTDV